MSKSALKTLSGLPEGFTVEQLGEALEKARAEFDTPAEYEETKENLLAVAHGNYDLEVPEDGNWSELVIFPTSQNESRGIEDARLVRFVDDDGSMRYYATYTAYNGFRIFPQLMDYDGGRVLKVRTLMGSGAETKAWPSLYASRRQRQRLSSVTPPDPPPMSKADAYPMLL